MLPPAESVNRASVAIGLVVAIAGVFILPWYVGSERPVSGESYPFGFHNKTASLALLIGAGIVSLGGWLSPNRRRTSARVLDWFEASPTFFDARAYERFVLALACVVMTWLITWLDSLLVIPYWGEADYFLSRIDLVAMGYRPYVDFQYNYGPLLLYAPVWLDGLSQGSLGIEAAYTWTVVAMTVLGFVAMWFFLRALAIPDQSRPWVLLLALAIWVPLTMGLNYVPIRFAFVPFALALFHWIICRLPREGSLRAMPAASAMGLTTLAFLLSPEMGIACCAGLTVYCAMLAVQGERQCALVGIAGVLAAGCAVHVFSKGYFAGLQAFAGGANNFPILPNLHNLLLVFTAIYVLGSVGTAVLGHHSDPRAPFAAAIGAAAAVLVAPALGRCDPGHVLLNGLLLFLCMFPAAAAKGTKWLRAYGVVFATAFIILMQFSYWSHYSGPFSQAIAASRHYEQHPEQVAAWGEAWARRKSMSGNEKAPNWRRVAPYPAWADEHEPLRGRISLPLAADIGLDRYAKLAKNYSPAFHPVPKTEVLTPDAVKRAAADALLHPCIILPERFAAAGSSAEDIDLDTYSRQISKFLTGLMLFPVDIKATRQPFLPDVEVSRALMQECDVLASGNGIVVLAPRNRSAVPSR